ncbi:MAG: RHS repeat-associated core domain-containing protein [Sneathiella sp.]
MYEHDDDLPSLDHGFTGAGVTFDFAYNTIGQRTSLTTSETAFAFTPVSNDTVSYTVNNLNQYSAIGAVSPAYDTTGNMTSDGLHTFVFDTENRLVSATNPAMTASYAYDPHGRRVSKTVDSVTTAFLLDGSEEIADYDGNGQMLRRYIYGPGTDEPVAMVEISSGNRSYFHQDGLGSVAALSDDSGTMTDAYTYGPYGETASPSGSPYRFTGRRLDAETGLYYYRARYYSPAQGRFLSPDPIGYGDGMNMYAYVGNDPINFVDPSGLFKASVANTASKTWSKLSSHGRYVANDISRDIDRFKRRPIKFTDSVLASLPGVGKGLSGVVRLGKAAGKGLTTPSKYFGSKTYKQAEKALNKKFGAPKGGANNKSFYNKRTKRTYNLHQDPLHRGGKPHIDIRKRGLPTNYYKNRPFFLKE